MMKWGRKKKLPVSSSSSSSSNAPSVQFILASNVFSKSWLSRFKNGKGSAEGVLEGSMGRKSPVCGSWDEGRIYGGDDDDGDESYRRLSFDKEWCEGENVLSSSDGKLNVSPVSCESVENMVWNGRKIRELIGAEAGLGRMRRKALKERKLRKEKRRGSEEREVEPDKEKEKVAFEIEPAVKKRDEDCRKRSVDYSRRRSMSLPNLSLRTIGEDYVVEDSNLNEEWQRQETVKINQTMFSCEKHRKSVHISRETHRRRSKQGRKVRAYSPKTVARVECKIKALEDLKRTRMKVKEIDNERTIKDAFRTGLDAFAIIKTSFNPQQDFRNSMVEMIIEKDIRQPEELEELLACYLTLNCDEYHDLIVKVFRQVWFELNQVQFDSIF